MAADRIKTLREQKGLTLSDLGITRSDVNAWEMKISVPYTPYIVELAHIFGVQTFLFTFNILKDRIKSES